MTRLTTVELRAEQARLLALANELARRHWGVDYTGTLRLTARNWTRRGACFAWALDLSRQEIRMSTTVNAEIGAAAAEETSCMSSYTGGSIRSGFRLTIRIASLSRSVFGWVRQYRRTDVRRRLTSDTCVDSD